MKIFKKVLATILCVVMVFGSAPLAGFVGLELPSIGDIFTTKAEAATSGTCGDNLTWTFDESTGELVISGTGDMDNWSNYLSEFCAPWYSNRLNIKTLTILDGVTSIGNYAFYNLTSLTNITIPDSVISIGNGAFLSCSDFKSITIPDGVTSIGDSAFESCSNLRGITIPDSVTHVGVSVFESCNNLGNSGSVKIGSGLTAISDSMFYNCDCLYSVTIPYGITSIGDSAFSNSECFSSVTIPESVTSIGHSAFFYCDSLYRITVPESVTSIGSNAFYNTSYYKNSSNWENNLLYIGNCLINAKSSVSGDCSIKEGTIVIADNVFRYCESLTSVTIPDSVTSIGNGVFNGCDSLERIEIGKGVTNIDVLAFNNCKNLTSITVNSGNLYYSSDESGVLYNKDKTDIIKYPAGKTDTTYVVSDNVMGICDYAFSDCVNLTSIEIGKGVTNIGKAIFKGSLNLTSITVDPSNTYYITDEFGTLYDINKTEIIKYPATKEIASYTIPDSVIIVADYSFENCLSLKSVIIGNSVTTIGDYAFTNCENLTSITIGSGLKIVGNYAFEYCLKLENIVFPDGFKVMGHYVFSDCENLTRVTIPDSITNIGDLPFLACYKSPAFYYTGTPEQWVNVVYYGISKDDIVFESNSEKPYFYDDYGENLTWKLYTSTGELVFYGVGDMKDRASNSGAPWYRRENIIKSITISDGITSIGAYAFRGMSFESLTIPASLKSVGVSAFYESALINIYYKGDLSGWCNINFESDAFTVHNYAGNLFICGKLLMGDVVIPDGVTRIPNYAFYNCSSIKSVTIPDSVKSIGYSAFKSCSGLKSITIPDSVSSIGSNAFCLCSSLSKIELSKNIKSIGTKTFYGCNSLKSIIIPDSVASIDYMAFSECRSLTNVIIGDGVTYIGSFAFDWCTNLKNITIPSGITRWGDEPFRACYSIENVYFTGEISDWCEMSFNGSFYPLEMGGNLYINGELLKVLELPDSMSNIEKYSFDNCKSLTKVIFSDNFIVVGEGAFTSCSNILEVRIGKDTQLIKKDAFYGCNKIETVYYPGTLEEWNEITILDGNDSLKNAKIIFECDSETPNMGKGTLESGHEWVINSDNELVISGDGEMTDYSEASPAPWTERNASIKSIRIDESITDIGDNAFDGLTNIEKIYYDGNAEEWNNVSIGEGNDILSNKEIIFSEYKVTWVVDEEEKSDYVAVGEEIVIPKNPEKTGYTFVGWTPEIPATMPAEDVTITAVFSVNSYDAMFNANGGSWSDGATEKTVSTEYGAEIVAPENPVRPGYIFSKWTPEVGVMDDVNGKTFTAEWIASTDTVYTVETYTMNTAGEYEKTVQTLNGATDSTVNAEYNIEEGFTFNSEKSVISGVVSADNSLVLKVYIDRNIYSFTTNIDGVSESEKYYYGSIIPEIIPEKTGYSFVGWDKNVPSTMPAEDLTITAEFKANSYDAVFNANGGKFADGEATKTVATDFDSEIIAPENPERAGYDFVGWDSEIGIMDDVNGKTFNAEWTARNDTAYTVETYVMDVKGEYVVTSEIKQGTTDTEVSVNAETMTGFTFNSDKSVLDGTIAADGSLVLKVYYDRNKYTFTTVADGISTESEYYYEAEVVTPEAPQKIGYTFANWDNEIPSTMPANDVTITAVFSANNYDAVFNANGGAWADGATEKTVVTAFDSEIIVPENPTKQGYIFSKWTPEVEKMDDVNGKTFKAEWLASTETIYAVETYTMNIDGEYVKTVQNFTGATDSVVNAEYSIKEGFTFNEEKSIISGIVAADNSLVLKVYIDRNQYTFKTVVDGVSTETNYYYDAEITVPDTPVKTGYTFVKWDNVVPAKMPANDVTVTAVFSANNYDAVFNANGGAWSDGATEKTVVTAFDSEIISPENPAKQGYIFSKWTPEVGKMDDVNGKTFKAEWLASTETVYAVETYTMNIEGEYVKTVQNFTGATDSVVNAEYSIKEGFTFNEEKSIISGVVAADNSLVLKVYYDRNKYTFKTIVDGVEYFAEYYYDAEVTAPQTPSKTGYTFVKWDNAVPSKMPAKDVTVNAVWKLNSYNVKWIVDGKVVKNENVNYGGGISAPTAPAKTGYAFKGWTPEVPATMPANDLTFTAVYEASGPVDQDVVKRPSQTTISYGDAIILHVDASMIPAGGRVEWTASNNNFSYKANGTTCEIHPEKSGDTTFTATIYDADGNPVSTDEQTMTAKAGFFDKIIAFFKKLFGLTKTIPQFYKSVS